MFDLFFFLNIMVTRICAQHVEKIRKVYPRFISLERAFQKTEMIDLFLFLSLFGHHDVCSLFRENLKSLPSIYLARGRSPENGAKNSKIFDICVNKGENWDVRPIFIFSFLWTPGCGLTMSKKKFTVDLFR